MSSDWDRAYRDELGTEEEVKCLSVFNFVPDGSIVSVHQQPTSHYKKTTGPAFQ